jgi:hypothetical protein
MANEREQAMEAARDFYARWMADKDNDGCTWGTADVLADFAIEYATAEGIPQADGWVAIETVEDLPKEEGLRCLVTRRGHVELLVWCDHYKSWDDATGDDHECDAMDVTAWQPLPAPYQRKSEGDSK